VIGLRRIPAASAGAIGDRPEGCWHSHVKGVVLHENGICNNWRLEDVWLDT
jgi:hypothetical protein